MVIGVVSIAVHPQGKSSASAPLVRRPAPNRLCFNDLNAIRSVPRGPCMSTRVNIFESGLRGRSFDPSIVDSPCCADMRNSSADVVIIGGGIIGASIAWHLASRGARSVRVLERADAPAAGSTGRATGGFRAQYGTNINVRLSLLSLAQLTTFADEHGVDPEYQPVGYLFMARTAQTLDTLRAAMCVQHNAGYTDGHEVSTDDIRKLSPGVNAEQFIGGVYAARDGYINPRALLDGLIRSAVRAHASFSWSNHCIAIERDADRVTAVLTPDERIACGTIINAAGPWAAGIGALAGVPVPITPRRRHVGITLPTSALPANTPMTVAADEGFHLRVRGDRVLMISPHDPLPLEPYNTDVDTAWVHGLHAEATRVVPSLVNAPLDVPSCWTGLYENSPDGHLLFGACEGIANFLLANGSSGHGVMHSLAIGQLMAELVCDGRAHSLDMSSLSPDRFNRGQPILGAALL